MSTYQVGKRLRIFLSDNNAGIDDSLIGGVVHKKFDGYRLHARLDHGAVTLLTRTGIDWTHKYPTIAKAVTALDALTVLEIHFVHRVPPVIGS